MGKTKKSNLFAYLDYRKFLKDYYHSKKTSRAGFSLRTFSKKAGFGSSNIFKRVMDGERNLTLDSLNKFAVGLGLNKAEQEYFRILVTFNQTQSHDEKNLCYKKLLQFRHYKNLKSLEKAQYEFLSVWYHAVVRELITAQDFDGEIDGLVDKITPKLSIKQVKKSIQLLEKLGMIKKTKDQKWQVCDSIMSTGPECESVTIMNYHKNLLRLVHQELENVPALQRDVSAVVIGVDKNVIPQIKKRVQDFRQDILKLVSGQKKTSEVVAVAIQLFPLTKTWNKDL